MSLKSKYTFPAIILLSICLVYSNCLSNGFVWLDQAEIIHQQLIISDFSDFIQKFFVNDNNYAGYHRPMYNLIHTFDYTLWGENAFGFHLSSLILHIANAWLLFGILNHISGKKQISVLVALIFGLLPCHTAAVSLIHSKADLLAVFFILSPIYWYSRSEFKFSKELSSGKVLLYSFSLLLALLSKEVAIMLPFFMISISWILRDKNIKVPKALLVVCGVLSTLFLAWRLSSSSATSNPDALMFLDRIFTFIPTYVNYILFTLTGVELTTNDAVKVWSHHNVGVFFFYVCLFAVLVAAQYLYAKRSKYIAAGFIWFNLFLVPVAQIIPILHFRADRFMYLPSIGFIVAVVFILHYYYERLSLQKHKKNIIILLSVLLVTFSIRTWDRNKDFQSDHLLFGKLIESHPECREAHGFLGNDYLIKGQLDKALLHIEKALEEPKEYYSFVDKKSNYGNLGVLFLYQNKNKEALEIFLRLKAEENYNPEILFNIGICQKRLRNFQKAKSNLEEYLKYKPDNIDALFNLGAIGTELRDADMIQKYFHRYLELNPNSEYRKDVEEIIRSNQY